MPDSLFRQSKLSLQCSHKIEQMIRKRGEAFRISCLADTDYTVHWDVNGSL
jgi:hypothetical protein